MGAVHELREEYRIYRIEHPGYRWLFLIIDAASLLIKLALLGGFIFLCWYIISRSPHSEQIISADSTQKISPEQVVESEAPELTSERIALLKQIAGEGDASQFVSAKSASNEALVGLVTLENTDNTSPPAIESAGTTVNDVPGVASVGEPLSQPPVRVESLASSGYDGIDGDIPTVVPEPQPVVEFADNVFIPEAEASGNWVLDQNASDYTVQLALTINVEFLVDFAKQVPDEYVATIYPERQNPNGDIQYSLSAGSFPTQRGAEAALAALPEQIKRYGAHIRAFEELQNNTSEFLK